MNQSIPTQDYTILRQEILDSQKARVDLLKYKLIIIAAVASIGLGVNGNNPNVNINIDLILCIIPFACIYVDLLCYHNTIRILVIGVFLKTNKSKYEVFISKLDSKMTNGVRYLFNLEDFALQWSSVFLSLLLIIYGTSKYLLSNLDFTNQLSSNTSSIIFILSGIIGSITPLIGYNMYRKRFAELLKNSKKEKKKNG